MKIIIVGGVAGGAGTAARLRRMDENAEIIVFERGKHLSFANCGLPYYIGGTIEDRNSLFVVKNQLFADRFDIDVRPEQEVLSVDVDKKTVTVRDLVSGKEYRESFDKLVLSPGASPVKPQIKGVESNRIFTLKNIPDADNIKEFIIQHKVKKAVVVGAGFIGLEMVENLHNMGVDVTLVEMQNRVMTTLDFSMAAIVHAHLKQKNVNLVLSKCVNEFEEKDGQLFVGLDNGDTLCTDIAILSIGVRPETRLAKEAGIEIGTLGGIKINEYMQTSNPGIYALGDAVEVIHPITGQPALIPLAGPANKQARIVADNIVFGNTAKYKGSYGVCIAKLFDLTVASAGANAKMLKESGIEYISSYTHSASHATYYPGAKQMSIKIMFSPASGELYGAQIVGFDGVDKRMEMLAGVIRYGGTVQDLCELEQAYAPPYSSAKDPVNMAGFVADNILTGKMKIAHWRSVTDDDFKLDVRTPKEFSEGHIQGSINIPLDDLRGRMGELPKTGRIVVNCAIGLRSYIACRILIQNGFKDVVNLSGGYKTYSTATA